MTISGSMASDRPLPDRVIESHQADGTTSRFVRVTEDDAASAAAPEGAWIPCGIDRGEASARYISRGIVATRNAVAKHPLAYLLAAFAAGYLVGRYRD
jgi:hypothetical protein